MTSRSASGATTASRPASLIRIGRQSFIARMLLAAGGSGASAGAVAGAAAPGLIRVLLPSVGPLAEIGLVIAFVILISAVGLALAALLVPGLRATADGASIRVGRRTIDAGELSRATLQVDRALQPSRDLLLHLHAPRVRAAVWLRSRGRVLLSDEEQQVLLRVLARSGVEPPRSAFDPAGRFTHANFPGALTKEEALDLVRNVGDAAAPLPITR